MPGTQNRDGSRDAECAAVPVRGVVLAGGESSRFDAGDKALARVDGVPMLRRTATALRDAFDAPPAVAAGDTPPDAYRTHLPDAVCFVPEAPGRRGPLAGLAGAAAALRDDWLFAAATDMPALTAPVAAWLAQQRTDGVDAVVATDVHDVPQPLCACYRRSALGDALETVPADAGPHALFDELATTTRSPADAPPGLDLGRALANVNTTGDLDDLTRTNH